MCAFELAFTTYEQGGFAVLPSDAPESCHRYTCLAVHPAPDTLMLQSAGRDSEAGGFSTDTVVKHCTTVGHERARVSRRFMDGDDHSCRRTAATLVPSGDCITDTVREDYFLNDRFSAVGDVLQTLYIKHGPVQKHRHIRRVKNQQTSYGLHVRLSADGLCCACVCAVIVSCTGTE